MPTIPVTCENISLGFQDKDKCCAAHRYVYMAQSLTWEIKRSHVCCSRSFAPSSFLPCARVTGPLRQAAQWNHGTSCTNKMKNFIIPISTECHWCLTLEHMSRTFSVSLSWKVCFTYQVGSTSTLSITFFFLKRLQTFQPTHKQHFVYHSTRFIYLLHLILSFMAELTCQLCVLEHCSST